MRQLNIAQRSANFIASLRDCAFVAGNKARLLLLRLLHAHLGTSIKPRGIERPEIYSWSLSFCSMWCFGPKMVPATFTTRRTQTTGKRGS